MTTETYSPGEETFNRRRQAFGLVVGPLLALAILFMPSALPPAAQRVGAVLALMIVFWMTEALPLAVTALLGPTLCVILGVATAQAAYAPFADPVIFLFIGSFILAEGMIAHRLDRRLAFTALASVWVGSSGLRLVVAYAGVTCFLSMWMSNTATTAMMFPLGLAVLSELGRERKGDSEFQRYAMAMMLVTSFAATIGGMGTPVGTPPNLIGIGLLRTTAGINVSFTGWMMVGVPDHDGHDGLARRVVSAAEVSRHSARARHRAHGRRRVAQIGIDDERRAQCRIRVLGDGRAVDIARRVQSRAG